MSARFFLPQESGAGATPAAPTGVFRIDHDEHFNQTTHLQYQIGKTGPWVGFNWRYDSGLVAGAVPFATDTTTHPEDDTPSRGEFIDVTMMIVTGGRERTVPEYRSLLCAAGFRLTKVVTTSSGFSVIEALPD